MAVTKSAGRVSIRVLPDTTGFRNDLRDYLKNIERSMRVKIKAQPVVDKTALQKMKQEIEDLMIKIKPTIDLEVSKEQIEEIKAQIERMRPEVNVMLNTARAATRMANLTRTRTVTIVPRLSRAAMASVAARLGALAGLGVITDSFAEASHWLRNIDRMAVKVGTVATLVAGVVANVGALIGTTLAMGSQLLDVIGLLSVLPAFAISTGLVIGTLVAVLKDAGEVLEEYGPAFSRLQDNMSENFWSHLILPIRSLYETHFPAFSKAMIDLSNATGDFGREIVETFQEHVTVERMATMFERLEKSIRTAEGMVDPLMHAFTLLGLHGTKYMDRLSKAMVNVSEDFDDFITKAYNDGRLEQWTEDAIQAMKDLGRVTSGTWRFFSELSRAAQAAGAADLGDFADALHRTADVMSRPAFQGAMTKYFEGFGLAVAGIVQGLKDMGPGLVSFADPFKASMESVGGIFETVLGYLGDMLEHPVLQKGLTDFFGGIEAGVENLGPGIDDLASGLGGMLSLLGVVAEELGETIGTLLDEWGPIFDDLGGELETLARPLGDLVRQLIEDLSPAFRDLTDNVLVPLIATIRDHVIPAVSDLIEEIGPELIPALQDATAAFRDEIIPALEEFMGWIRDNKSEIGWFAGIIGDIAGGWAKVVIGGKPLSGEGATPKQEFDFIADWFERNFRGPFNKEANRMWDEMIRWFDEHWPKLISNIFSGGNAAWAEDVNHWFETNLNEPIRSWFESLPAKFDAWWLGFWEDFWHSFTPEAGNVQPLQAFNEMLMQWLEDLYNGFKGWFQDTFTAGWDRMWSDLLGAPERGMEEARAGMGDQFDEWGAALDAWALGLGESWNVFWGETFPMAWTNFTTWFGEGWNLFWGETLPAAWTNFSTWLTEGWNLFWGTTLPEGWNTFTTTLSEGWTNFWTVTIPEIWNGFVSWLGESWDLLWSTLGETLSTAWSDFQESVGVGVENIQADIESFGAVVGELWNTLWENVRQRLSEAWDNIVAEISESTGISEADIRAFAANALSWVIDGFSQIVTNVQTYMANFETAVNDGINGAVEWLQGLPGRAVEAIGDLGQTLVASGSSLIGGFISGMGSRMQDIRNTASSLLEAARNFFPFSPAKEGPFSGRGWTAYSGAALIDGFADGMTSRMGAARTAARKVMEAVDLTAVSDNFNDLDGNGVVIDRREVNVHTYNPVAEPTSRTIEKASSELRMAGAI